MQHGIPKPVLKDFPYAEDGLLVWNAIEEYFGKYLRLYYCDKGSNGKLKASTTCHYNIAQWFSWHGQVSIQQDSSYRQE